MDVEVAAVQGSDDGDFKLHALDKFISSKDETLSIYESVLSNDHYAHLLGFPTSATVSGKLPNGAWR